MFFVLPHVILAYLLGSISSGVLISHLLGKKDPRHHGSKSSGATNVYRTSDKKTALCTLLADAGKAYLAMMPLEYYAHPTWTLIPVGIAVFIGHCYPCFHDFKGGKGVVVTFCILTMLSIPIGLLSFLIWLLIFLLFARVSVASLSASLITTVISYNFLSQSEWCLLALLTMGLYHQHRENITRIRNGQEKRMFKWPKWT